MTAPQWLSELLAEHQIESMNLAHVDCWCGWTVEPTCESGNLPAYHRAHVAEVIWDALTERARNADVFVKGSVTVNGEESDVGTAAVAMLYALIGSSHSTDADYLTRAYDDAEQAAQVRDEALANQDMDERLSGVGE